MKKYVHKPPTNEMEKIISAAIKEAKQSGITDKYDIHLLVLKKENDFYKQHLKNINTQISQYIQKTVKKKQADKK